jgi:hypothetical protein
MTTDGILKSVKISTFKLIVVKQTFSPSPQEAGRRLSFQISLGYIARHRVNKQNKNSTEQQKPNVDYSPLKFQLHMKGMPTLLFSKAKKLVELELVAHTCNPSYLGG